MIASGMWVSESNPINIVNTLSKFGYFVNSIDTTEENPSGKMVRYQST